MRRCCWSSSTPRRRRLCGKRWPACRTRRSACGDGFAALAAGGYDLAFIDPPFGSEAFERALAAVHADARWLYLEAPRAIAPPAGWRLHRHLKAGAVHAHLFARDNPGP